MKIQRYVAYPELLCKRKCEVLRIDFQCGTVDVIEKGAVKGWTNGGGDFVGDCLVSGISLKDANLKKLTE